MEATMDEAKRGAMLRREFEKMLKEAGASKTQRVEIACILHPDVIEKLLSPWRRFNAWRLARC
jgi:hypothetical protein